ncbi:Ribokinase-like protein [Cryphonectria parasitica EP155]|uniref:ATP-dependent (S)-NAD(P)H-hydrate dehydratase n=1 Tax=Cryphonectria parasitica (strain ATCC 38755 / EP155) TaxID=660469 RepID=A0A9P4XXL8_CRYP1|nr:Ribokinase-like protein [Cryphonectria parasitica EP155]KAF3762640.1 Ribokinase-like protein [Cryphonectria parasitica EP155]
MSPATRELLGRVRQLVPPMLDKFHKGQQGRIGVIGGSEDYTGAPYFSAMASARLGCDMSHVICTPGAASVIKTYSPNLMVHPLMRQSPSPNTSDESSTTDSADTVASPIIDMLARLHVLVVGPGLGRDPLMQDTVAKVISAAREKNTPVVLDADALFVVQKRPEIVKGYKLAVLTPNVVEFGRLCKALGLEEDEEDEEKNKKETAKVEALARALGGVTVVQKGFHDFVSDGETTLVVDLEGGKKRSGGQGDTLTGSVATFLGWRQAYLEGLWDHGGKLDKGELVQLAAFGGCAITRASSRQAFEKKGRSLQASDLTDEVHIAFLKLFGEDEPDVGSLKL